MFYKKTKNIVYKIVYYYMKEQIILWWAKDGYIQENDYPMGGVLSLVKPYKTWSWYEDRQWTSECVVFGIMWCVTDNNNYTYTDFDKWILRKMLPDYWWDLSWMYTSKWGDCMVDFFKLQNKVLIKESVYIYSQTNKFFELLDLWWTLTLGSLIDEDYIKDIQADWDIDILFGWDTWHLRRIWRDIREWSPTKWLYYIIENFKWSLKYNVIEITREMLESQIKNKRLHNVSYYFYFLDNPKPMPIHNTGNTQTEKEIVSAWEVVIQQWFIPTYKVYNDEFYIDRMLIDIALARKWIK